jgi:hypothetical protein
MYGPLQTFLDYVSRKKTKEVLASPKMIDLVAKNEQTKRYWPLLK